MFRNHFQLVVNPIIIIFCFLGVLDSPKTCLHSILAILEQGLGTREGPTCLIDRPRLAEMCYHLVHALSANKDTSPPTLRYLRTTHDFLYKQLQHLPLDSGRYSKFSLSICYLKKGCIIYGDILSKLFPS